MAASENESGAGSMASSQGLNPALEMLLNSKFEDMSTQFGFFETRLDAIDKKLSVLDTLDQKLAKLESLEKMHLDVEAITKQQVADAKVLGGVASMQAEASKAIDKMAGTVEDTQQRLLEVKDYSKDTLDSVDKRLSVLDSLDQRLSKFEAAEQKMSWSGGVEQRLAALRSKTTTAENDEVDRPTLDSKLDAMAERIQVRSIS